MTPKKVKLQVTRTEPSGPLFERLLNADFEQGCKFRSKFRWVWGSFQKFPLGWGQTANFPLALGWGAPTPQPDAPTDFLRWGIFFVETRFFHFFYLFILVSILEAFQGHRI